MVVIDYSTKNGLGRPALSIHFSGCDKPVKCKGCHNTEMWEPVKGIDMTELIDRIDKKFNFYKTFSSNLMVAFMGGEPLAEYNKGMLREISKYIKEKYPNTQTVVYSWRTRDMIQQQDVEYIDFGVLGSYDETKRQEGFLPASSNQEIWDFKKGEKIEKIKLR